MEFMWKFMLENQTIESQGLESVAKKLYLSAISKMLLIKKEETDCIPFGK